MAKKNEFSDLVTDLDQKLKDIESRKKTVTERIKKLDQKNHQETIDTKKAIIQERKTQADFRMKEKLTYGAIVFVIGQMLLIPICWRYSEVFGQLWLFGTISLGVICVAVIDFG